jgi:hypothetical protein
MMQTFKPPHQLAVTYFCEPGRLTADETELHFIPSDSRQESTS